MKNTKSSLKFIFSRRFISGIILIALVILTFLAFGNKLTNSGSITKKPPVDHTKLPTETNIINAGSHSFDTIVSGGLVLVDFWADWCPPCRLQNPILEDLASDENFQASIVKVNVDYSRDLAARFNVRNIPTLILFKDGEPVERLVGLQQKENLESIIYKHL